MNKTTRCPRCRGMLYTFEAVLGICPACTGRPEPGGLPKSSPPIDGADLGAFE